MTGDATDRALEPGGLPRLSAAALGDTLRRFCAVGNRFVGSEGERAARELLLHELAEAGLADVRAEEFDVLGYRGLGSSCELVGGGLDAPSTGLQFTASGEIEADAVYAGRPQSPEDIADLGARGISIGGRIVVVNSYYSYLYMDEILRRGAVGLVVIGEVAGGIVGNYSAQMYPPPEPPEFAGSPLPIPGVTVELEAGHRLLAAMSAGSRRLRIAHEASYLPTRTANVVAELPGREDDTLVVIGAHYDTQAESHGYVDNGSGIAALVEIARSWRSLRPRRRVVFVAFGDEEHGSPGATAYCRRHAESLPRTVGMVNLDALGWAYPAAKRNVFVDPSLEDFALESARALGWSADVVVEGNSFPGYDCNPFLDAGVPTAWFWRFPPQHPYYHSAGDTPDLLDLDMIAETASVAAYTAFRLAHEPELGVGRARPSRTWLDFGEVEAARGGRRG